jgi:hypothetical protein
MKRKLGWGLVGASNIAREWMIDRAPAFAVGIREQALSTPFAVIQTSTKQPVKNTTEHLLAVVRLLDRLVVLVEHLSKVRRHDHERASRRVMAVGQREGF